MKKNSVLKFTDYVVDEIIFKNNYSDEESFNIDFDIDSNVNFKDETNFELHMVVELFKSLDISPFKMRVKVTGFFQIESMEAGKKENFVKQNAVAILFPYVRALISNYTALCNVPPLILPPINVVEYIKNKSSEI
ncbi:preprotein translocase subunit SecB [Hathewaya proteolytica DSM 3090]|uniref:Preprotein translocase subunit SecB n=1 Tax=Hathewaya proteolytica DSM 3090 TaxID=1121331 RepID=A0A1M6NVI6_9CLOT|nr:protein-export chaperone SecB [Hathewaya proteolytica]SHJ99661.1 preprotein translocase subunit SecB [Hathewaya proteolytica DSM 3090]